MNITEDKLKTAIQIALGMRGIYTKEAETLLIHHIKALTIPDVVSSYVFAHTSGDGDYGNEFVLHNLYKNKKDAANAVKEYEYNSRIEEMEVK